nr:hypothetical protein [Comamonas thiooxydans]
MGVCYGHQLMAHALGGAVDYHPDGREMGSLEIEQLAIAEPDAWLAGCPPYTSSDHPAPAQWSQGTGSLSSRSPSDRPIQPYRGVRAVSSRVHIGSHGSLHQCKSASAARGRSGSSSHAARR